MPKLSRVAKNQLYNEAEAAASLGITVARLHQLLDEHIFTGDTPRPQCIQFTASDLLLLGYWCNGTRSVTSEVITMPRRN